MSKTEQQQRGTGGVFVSGDKSGTLSRKRANTEGSHAAGKSTGTRWARENQLGLPARISFSIGFRKIETRVQKISTQYYLFLCYSSEHNYKIPIYKMNVMAFVHEERQY